MSGKLQNNNIYTIAKRNVEGQDMLYQSLKLTNGIWILAELRIQPGNPNYTVSSLVQAWANYNPGAISGPISFSIRPAELEKIILKVSHKLLY